MLKIVFIFFINSCTNIDFVNRLKGNDGDIAQSKETADDRVSGFIGAAINGNVKLVKKLLSEKIDIESKDKEGLTALILASKNNYKDVVKELLLNGADVNAKDNTGRTALMEAVIAANEEIVRMLLAEKDIDIEAATFNNGWTALMYASQCSRKGILDMLLKVGANLSAKTKDNKHSPLSIAFEMLNRSPYASARKIARTIFLATDDNMNKEEDFILSAMKEDTDKVVKLIKEGVDVNFKSKIRGGKTALMLASLKGNTEIVDILIKEKAKVGDKDLEDRTALMYAASEGKLEVVKKLLKKCKNPNDKDIYNKTALMLAVEEGYKEVVELLIKKGAKIDIKKDGGDTPLIVAVEKGHKEIVELLIKEGGKLSDRDRNEWTLLMVAANNAKNTEIAEMLIEKGVGIEEVDIDGWTSLMIASMVGKPRIVELLLKKGARIDKKDKDGKTALMFAVENYRYRVVNFLLENGANINEQDKLGNSILISMLKNKKIEDEQLLKMKEFLIEKGIDLKIRNESGDTALSTISKIFEKDQKNGTFSSTLSNLFKDLKSKMQIEDLLNEFTKCCYEGDLKRVKELLKEDPNRVGDTDDTGNTALMLAVESGNIELVEFLIEKGADIEATNINLDKRYALSIAANAGNEEMVKLLLKKGANANVNKNGSFSYCYNTSVNSAISAIKGGNINIVKIMIEANKNENLEKALKYATTSDLEICKLIFKEIKSENLKKALSNHSYEINLEVLRLILEEMRIDLDLSQIRRYLKSGVSRGDLDLVRYILILERVDLNDKALNSNEGYNLLTEAINKGYTDLSKLLIENGIDINYTFVPRGNHGSASNSLISAIKRKNIEIISILIEKGVEIKNALKVAVKEGNSEIKQLLIGAMVEEANKVKRKELLIESIEIGFKEAIAILVEKTLDIDNIFITAIKANNSIDILELLIEKGIGDKVKDEDGATALMIAAEKGNVDSVRFLLERGADINECRSSTLVYTIVNESSASHIRIEVEGIDSVLSRALESKNEDLIAFILSKEDLIYKNIGAVIIRLVQKSFSSIGIKALKLLLNRLEELGKTEELFKVDHPKEREDIDYEGINALKLTRIAIGFNNEKLLKLSLKKGVNLNHFDWRNKLLLMIASNDKNMLKMLIEAGADVNVVDNDGSSPLYFAVSKNNLEAVKILVRNGANIDFRREGEPTGRLNHVTEHNSDYSTVLIKAINRGRIKVVDFLIKSGANLERRNYEGETPLMIAYRKKWKAAIIKLLKAGANVSAQNKLKNSETVPTMETVNFARRVDEGFGDGSVNLFELLVREGKEVDFNKGSLMQEIIKNYYQDYKKENNLLRYALSKGGSINTRNAAGYTLFNNLVYSFSEGGLFNFLLDNREELKLDLELENYDGNRPIHSLATAFPRMGSFNPNNNLVCRVLESGLDANAKNSKGETALHLAIKHLTEEKFRRDGLFDKFNVFLFKKLIEVSDTSIVDADGLTPLILAVKLGNNYVLSKLIESGIDLNHEDTDGRKAIHHTANCSFEVGFRKEPSSLEVFVNGGADVSIECRSGRNMLHYAGCYGNSKVCEYLLGKGLDVNKRDGEGKTVLHHYAENFINRVASSFSSFGGLNAFGGLKKKDFAEFLIEKGVDVNVKDNVGRTALEIALILSKHEENTLVKILKEKSEEKNPLKSLISSTIENIKSKEESKTALSNRKIVDSMLFVELARLLHRLEYSKSEIEELELVKNRVEEFKNGYMYELFMRSYCIEKEVKEFIKNLVGRT